MGLSLYGWALRLFSISWRLTHASESVLRPLPCDPNLSSWGSADALDAAPETGMSDWLREGGKMRKGPSEEVLTPGLDLA